MTLKTLGLGLGLGPRLGLGRRLRLRLRFRQQRVATTQIDTEAGREGYFYLIPLTCKARGPDRSKQM